MLKGDVVGKIMDYEGGNMDDEQIIQFFQEIVDSGLVWELQGSYGRMATHLIKEGLVHRKGEKRLMNVKRMEKLAKLDYTISTPQQAATKIRQMIQEG